MKAEQNIKNINQQLKQKPKNQLKKPLLIKCFKCPIFIEIKYNRGQGKYVEKNNWGYWTMNEKNKNLYICDKCLLYIYREDKWEYLENISDEGRRRTFRAYVYDHTLSSN